MKRGQRTALLGALCDKLRERGSWCGETHIHKSVYVLQELLGVDTDFDFVLYKYGPYSFDLRDELTRLRGLGLFDLEQRYPYGPRIYSTEMMHEREERFPKTLARHAEKLDFVATHLGGKNVDGLERFATALYVTKDMSTATTEERAEYLRNLKPHVRPDDALAAVTELDEVRRELSNLALED